MTRKMANNPSDSFPDGNPAYQCGKTAVKASGRRGQRRLSSDWAAISAAELIHDKFKYFHLEKCVDVLACVIHRNSCIRNVLRVIVLGDTPPPPPPPPPPSPAAPPPPPPPPPPAIYRPLFPFLLPIAHPPLPATSVSPIPHGIVLMIDY